MTVSRTTVESFVSPEEFLEVVLDVEKYPEFLPEVKKVEVHERTKTTLRATFHVSIAFAGMDVDTHYTLDYQVDGLTVKWKLVASPDITTNEGQWALEETADGETVARYESDIVTSLPVSEDIQKAFAEQQMPKMMARFRDRVEG